MAQTPNRTGTSNSSFAALICPRELLAPRALKVFREEVVEMELIASWGTCSGMRKMKGWG